MWCVKVGLPSPTEISESLQIKPNNKNHIDEEKGHEMHRRLRRELDSSSVARKRSESRCQWWSNCPEKKMEISQQQHRKYRSRYRRSRRNPCSSGDLLHVQFNEIQRPTLKVVPLVMIAWISVTLSCFEWCLRWLSIQRSPSWTKEKLRTWRNSGSAFQQCS